MTDAYFLTKMQSKKLPKSTEMQWDFEWLWTDGNTETVDLYSLRIKSKNMIL